MCRLVGWVADRPLSLSEVLGQEALDRLVGLSSFHGDGWGLAWRDPKGLQVARSLLAARLDPAFTAMAHQVRVRAALVHLRWATPGFGHELADTHPFVLGDYAMAHNGAIDPSGGIGALLVDGAASRPGGSTDSEHLLYGVIASLPAANGDLVTALERTSTRGAAAGLHAASLNSMFLAPDGLHVVNWHDPSRVPEAAARSNAADPANPPYFDLRYRSEPGLDVVVSSGFVPDASSWTLLSPASVTHIAAPGRARSRDLAPELPLCPHQLAGGLTAVPMPYPYPCPADPGLAGRLSCAGGAQCQSFAQEGLMPRISYVDPASVSDPVQVGYLENAAGTARRGWRASPSGRMCPPCWRPFRRRGSAPSARGCWTTTLRNWPASLSLGAWTAATAPGSARISPRPAASPSASMTT